MSSVEQSSPELEAQGKLGLFRHLRLGLSSSYYRMAEVFGLKRLQDLMLVRNFLPSCRARPLLRECFQSKCRHVMIRCRLPGACRNPHRLSGCLAANTRMLRVLPRPWSKRWGLSSACGLSESAAVGLTTTQQPPKTGVFGGPFA